MKHFLRAFSAATLLSAPIPLLAQRGCFHSPEAPTAILMLVGSASMFYGSSSLANFIRRKRGR